MIRISRVRHTDTPHRPRGVSHTQRDRESECDLLSTLISSGPRIIKGLKPDTSVASYESVTGIHTNTLYRICGYVCTPHYAPYYVRPSWIVLRI